MEGAVLFVTAFLTLASMLFVIFRLNLRLGLIALIIVPAITVLIRVYNPRLRKSWGRVKTAETNALSVVQEVIGAIRVVKAFGQERREQRRLFEIARQGVLERMRVTVVEGEFNLLLCAIMAGGTATVLFFGTQAVLAEQLTTGELVLIMAYLAQLYTPIYTMGKQVGALQSSLASSERTFSILDERPAVVDVSKPIPLVRAKGNIVFDDVSFSYNSERCALRNVSFDVPAGTTVGIIGKTGAGKTTLVNLLTRFYDPSQGTIYLDGDDLKNYCIADLRSQFSIMLQEPVLFPTSIAENIAYGTPGASHDAIIAAAKSAYAHEFIEKLPEGYDTLVGDRGATLSGGERQRVSLARAFIKDSPLLILDEPTSSVDTETEKQIVEATLRLIADRTTFIIAHRQATLRRCDVLLLLNQGQLIQMIDDPQATLQYFNLDDKEDRIVDSSHATQAIHVDPS
jgi:ATP-binding cassette subfamily B protein